LTGYDPHQHAEELGLEVRYYPLKTCVGLYRADENAILIRPGLRAAVERSVLAHEIAHHLLGHSTPRVGAWARKQEIAADRMAAQALINPRELRDIARTTPDRGRWAVELGVSGDLLTAFLDTHSWRIRAKGERAWDY